MALAPVTAPDVMPRESMPGTKQVNTSMLLLNWPLQFQHAVHQASVQMSELSILDIQHQMLLFNASYGLMQGRSMCVSTAFSLLAAPDMRALKALQPYNMRCPHAVISLLHQHHANASHEPSTQ